MTHDLAHEITTYVVVSGYQQASNTRVRERLTDIFRVQLDGSHIKKVHLPDPFELHLIIMHEALLDAKAVITAMRGRLYDALDLVDSYSKQLANQRSRETLENLTLQLHVVSQDTDSMAASADMAAMIVRRIAESHRRYARSLKNDEKQDILMKTTDAMGYLSASIESQMRWLKSYKSRKDIAMNLVGHLDNNSLAPALKWSRSLTSSLSKMRPQALRSLARLRRTAPPSRSLQL
jgi:hypothetical protein